MPSNYFAHETAVIEPEAAIGEGTKIWHFSHVMGKATIGARCNLGQNVFVGSDVTLGANVKVQNNVSIYSGVVCEDDVFLGPSMVFTNVLTPRSAFPRDPGEDFQSTFVRRGATIGANVTIICGVTIGEHAMIGAGSVITRDVPAHALVYGNPAVQRGWSCECGDKLDFSESSQATCSKCGRQYERESETRIERKDGCFERAGGGGQMAEMSNVEIRMRKE